MAEVHQEPEVIQVVSLVSKEGPVVTESTDVHCKDMRPKETFRSRRIRTSESAADLGVIRVRNRPCPSGAGTLISPENLSLVVYFLMGC